MKTRPHHRSTRRSTRRSTAFILAGSIAALLASQPSTQAAIIYTDGQTDPTNYSTPDLLSIASGAARQTGILSGFGSYAKDGAGKLSLSPANTFTGDMLVFGGTLNVFNDSNLGASANQIVLAGGGPGSPTLQTSSTYSSHTLLALGSGTIDVAQGFTTLQNGALIGSTPPGQALTKTGGGTFFLGAGSGNTFSGNITLAVNGGTFQVGSSVSSSPAGGATLSSLTSANTITVNRGATFRIEDNGTASAAGYIADRLGSVGDRPAVSMNGGTFNLNGANNAAVMTQTLGTLTLASGASTINVTRNTTGTPELVFSSLSKNSGAFVNFTGSALGTGTNDGRILFTSAPTLVGGGGAANSPTISILPGARSGNDLVTYGANGIRPLVAAEYYIAPSNNINGAGATENVKISNATPAAFPALTGPKTINSLVNNAVAAGTWAMGNTLTLTSGQFINFPSGGSLNITSGVLTAGTFNGSPIDLDITNQSNNFLTIGANVNNNGSTVVALVKNGGQGLTLNATTDNTYSGGTFLNEHFIFTGNTANRRYLGTGAVVVNSGGGLTLGASGATSFSGSLASPTYTVKTGGAVQIANVAPAANEFFKLESGAVFTNAGTTGAGGVNISGGSQNLDAAFGAVFAQTVAGANVAIGNGAGVITSLTTPTYYFGLAGTTLQENITVGSGTPWLGLSNDHINNRVYNGVSATNNTITANSDFTLQGRAFSIAGAPLILTLSLGNGASATNIIKIATPNGNVNANIVGSVSLNNDNSQYGSAGNAVTFQVNSGATLLANTATAMGVVVGAATAPASIVVQNGGTLTIGNAAAINGNVTVQPGGMFTQNQATLTGTGTFTHSNGSILNLITSTAAVSGATQALGTVPGTIVRMGINGLLAGTSTLGVTQLDSRLNNAAVYELTTGLTMGAAAAATDSLFTLSASGGIGGVLTNDATSRTLGAATGLIAIGSGGGTFAATTGTTLTVTENFALGANTLTIGSAQSYDGNAKFGTVSLTSTANTNTGSAGSVISVVNGATLQLGVSDQIPDATRLTVNNGATANIQSFSDTVAGVTLTGGTISGSSGVLTSTTAFDLQAGTVSAILGGTVGVNKTTADTVTLSGANTYTGGTTVNAGTLLLSGANNMPATGTLQVNAGGNFSLADVTARATTTTAALNLASGANLTFDWNAGAVDTLTSTAAATTTGIVGIIMNPANAPTGTGLTLLSSSSGGLETAGGTKYYLANNTNFTTTLAQSDTAVTIGGYTAVSAPATFYWQGNKVAGTNTAGADNALAYSNGSASNWSSTQGSYTATGVTPGSSANVIFSAAGAVEQSTVLGADMAVNSVTFNNSAAVAIGGPNTLTLMSAGTGASSAIVVSAAANANTAISSNVALGASQTWSVASGKNLAVSGTVSGRNSLTKADDGTLTLTGANTYTGDTTVKAGTLKLDTTGSISNSANIIVGDAGSSGAHLDVTTVNGGFVVVINQTLKGIGTIDGNTTILGAHAPGNSPGLQTVNGNLIYGTGSMVNLELGANLSSDTAGIRSVHFDAVDVTGTGSLSIASGVTSNLIFNGVGSAVDFADAFWDSDRSWLIYDGANAPTLSSGSIFDTINVSTDSLGATLAGGAFSWNQTGNDVYLKFTAPDGPPPVPEPTGVAIGLLCVGVAAFRRRRGA